MEYKTISTIERKGKAISFFLKEGEHLTYENIVDVAVHHQPERSKREDRESGCGTLNIVETQ